ncbi:MAG TPA: sulfate ABC transporter permease subunit [Thermoleophilaceae bacterium]|jgi:sulfate transport system permease protein
MSARRPLRAVVLGYLALLLAAPLGTILYRAFEHGVAPALDALTTTEALHALQLTLLVVAIAVPANTAFGIGCALAIVRGRFPGRTVLDRLVDLPFAVSPVVIGLALVLVYGQDGWLGGTLASAGVQVIFSTPGIALATIFVSLPFVVREVVPVLREIGHEQEEAARTLGASAWQTFRRVTLPAIRPAVGYGVVLTTARALGEFGAVSVVSGHLQGQTETLTLFVQQRYETFDYTAAYATSVLLAVLAAGVLVGMSFFARRERFHGD